MALNNYHSSKLAETIIQPETELEMKIISNPDFIIGVLWGKSRKGHPEGQVIYHIRQVLENVNKYSNSENRHKLRIVTIIHDSFKYKVDLSKPKSKDNDHAIFAREFAEQFINDDEILEIIELHDEAYNSWNEGYNTGNWVKAKDRALKLISRLGASISLYHLFYQCDNETGDKEDKCFYWFTNLVTLKK